MLAQLLMSLSWHSVLVLHNHSQDQNITLSLDSSGIPHVDYDISFSTDDDLQRILRDTEQVIKPSFNVLLLCDIYTTVSVLRQMGICGTKTMSAVDLCHVAKVLIVGTNDYLEELMDSNIKVENVAVVELPGKEQALQQAFMDVQCCSKGLTHHLERQESTLEDFQSETGQSNTTRLWTLVFHPNRRLFKSVTLSSDQPDVFPNVKFGYNNRQLTVVMKGMSYDFGFEIVNAQKVVGLQFRILQVMAEKLNFSYNVIPPREDEWGRDINGSWTGVLGMLQRREVDFAPEMMTIHDDRQTATDYILPPVLESKLMILYRKEEDVDQDHLAMIFLRPVLPHTLTLFGVSVVAFTVLLSCVRYIQIRNNATSTNKNADSDEVSQITPSIGTVAMTTLYEIYGASLKQGTESTVSHGSGRILVAAWWIFTTIFSAIYCGTIMATLAVRLQQPPFTNFAELAAREDYKIGFDSSSIISQYFQNTNRPDILAVRRRVDEISTTDPDVLNFNMTRQFHRVQQGKYALLLGTIFSFLGNTNNQLEVIDSKHGTAFLAFHIPRSSPFKHELEKCMYSLRDSGMLQYIFQEWVKTIPKIKYPVENFPQPVSLIKIQSIFYIIGIGLCCSALCLLAEVICYKRKTNT